jgi:hypothetical protein
LAKPPTRSKPNLGQSHAGAPLRAPSYLRLTENRMAAPTLDNYKDLKLKLDGLTTLEFRLALHRHIEGEDRPAGTRQIN